MTKRWGRIHRMKNGGNSRLFPSIPLSLFSSSLNLLAMPARPDEGRRDRGRRKPAHLFPFYSLASTKRERNGQWMRWMERDEDERNRGNEVIGREALGHHLFLFTLIPELSHILSVGCLKRLTQLIDRREGWEPIKGFLMWLSIPSFLSLRSQDQLFQLF